MSNEYEADATTDKSPGVDEISDAQLDDVAAGALLLPAVQSAREASFATPPKKHKVWPWHFW